MLTIAVALARDRLPLSETRDVDVLLRPCLLFVSFFCFVWVEGRRHVERRRGVVKGREREAGERAREGERNQEKRKKMSDRQAHADSSSWTCLVHPLTSALARGDQALRLRVQADAAEDGLRWLLLLRGGGGSSSSGVGEEACCGDLGRGRQRRR